ncbi:high mobility group B protein 10-like isoform X2 [Phalaenopsis equestris]|uniref:high mobility group B protein 10-like isoform X2 n=1 Tax=Phalaenopsis equestris TaxID=78828 RepID=UPI0009E34AC5|nr:high mobility group B protein 10-like isoform X2 [Phalaenopsis equestris]
MKMWCLMRIFSWRRLRRCTDLLVPSLWCPGLEEDLSIYTASLLKLLPMVDFKGWGRTKVILIEVIKDRIWKDVISAFNFPSTITNASFVLRKYYISLLQHYEEVYFFRNKVVIDPITGTNHGTPSVSKPNQVGTTGTHGTSGKHLTDPLSGEVQIDQEPLKQQNSTKIAQLKNSTGLHLPGYPPLEIGSWLRGEITGKFENGYLVTASYGSEKFTGVLYHTHCDASQSQTLSSSSSGQRSRKRPSQATEDPFLSKSNSSNLHLDHGVKVNPSLSTEEKKISKQLGDLWNRLTQPSNEDNQETESEG